MVRPPTLPTQPLPNVSHSIRRMGGKDEPRVTNPSLACSRHLAIVTSSAIVVYVPPGDGHPDSFEEPDLVGPVDSVVEYFGYSLVGVALGRAQPPDPAHQSVEGVHGVPECQTLVLVRQPPTIHDRSVQVVPVMVRVDCVLLWQEYVVFDR